MNKKLLAVSIELAEAAPYLAMLAEQPELAGACSISLSSTTDGRHPEVRAYLGHLLGENRLNVEDEPACIEAMRELAGFFRGQFHLHEPNIRADGSSFRALDVVIPMPGGGSLIAWADIADTRAPITA